MKKRNKPLEMHRPLSVGVLSKYKEKQIETPESPEEQFRRYETYEKPWEKSQEFPKHHSSNEIRIEIPRNAANQEK